MQITRIKNTKLQNKGIKIEYIPIDILKPADYNPREWDAEAVTQLKESIKKYGVVDPLLANSAEARKNIVIRGHFRLLFMRSKLVIKDKKDQFRIKKAAQFPVRPCSSCREE